MRRGCSKISRFRGRNSPHLRASHTRNSPQIPSIIYGNLPKNPVNLSIFIEFFRNDFRFYHHHVSGSRPGAAGIFRLDVLRWIRALDG